jgi:hypothetical protein
LVVESKPAWALTLMGPRSTPPSKVTFRPFVFQ